MSTSFRYSKTTSIKLFPDKEPLEYDVIHFFPVKKEINATEINVIIFFPGNPGLIDFYHQLLSNLHEYLPGHYLVGASHFGQSRHCLGNYSNVITDDNLYKIQVESKPSIIVKELREILILLRSQGMNVRKVNLTLAGHSFGGRVILEALNVLLRNDMLKDVSSEFKVEIIPNQIIGIAATIVNIGRSSNGQRILNLHNRHKLLYVVFMVLYLFLHFVKFLNIFLGMFFINAEKLEFYFAKAYFRWNKDKYLGADGQLGIEDEFLKVITHNLVEFDVFRNCLIMGIQEMVHMYDLNKDIFDTELIRKRKVKFLFLQAIGDEWVGPENEQQMRQIFSSFPKDQVIFEHMPQGTRHAFCLSHSANEYVARRISMLY